MVADYTGIVWQSAETMHLETQYLVREQILPVLPGGHASLHPPLIAVRVGMPDHLLGVGTELGPDCCIVAVPPRHETGSYLARGLGYAVQEVFEHYHRPISRSQDGIDVAHYQGVKIHIKDIGSRRQGQFLAEQPDLVPPTCKLIGMWQRGDSDFRSDASGIICEAPESERSCGMPQDHGIQSVHVFRAVLVAPFETHDVDHLGLIPRARSPSKKPALP